MWFWLRVVSEVPTIFRKFTIHIRTEGFDKSWFVRTQISHTNLCVRTLSEWDPVALVQGTFKQGNDIRSHSGKGWGNFRPSLRHLVVCQAGCSCLGYQESSVQIDRNLILQFSTFRRRCTLCMKIRAVNFTHYLSKNGVIM